ncbi:hypothetical protein AVEN_111819-1 [Araneus ventricosus]|uniref:Uncharacterized protein n=1 Tax=Araneus ventricosus TaxID=182803 RepID=A0A4Y2JK79_ARAVE|nr:hypothetical protein AVEN_111819-1 [Araneus ventricosus]
MKRGAVLQTWKVASQQCESYGWEESFTGIKSEIPITGEILEDLNVKSEFSGDPNTEAFEPDSKSNLLKRFTWSMEAVPP